MISVICNKLFDRIVLGPPQQLPPQSLERLLTLTHKRYTMAPPALHNYSAPYTLTTLDRGTTLSVSPGKHSNAGQQRSKRATGKLPKMRNADRYARVSRGSARSVSVLSAILRDCGEHTSRDRDASRIRDGTDSATRGTAGQRPICEYYRRRCCSGSSVGGVVALPGNANFVQYRSARRSGRHSIARPLAETQIARHTRRQADKGGRRRR